AGAGVAYAPGKRGQAFRLAGPNTTIDFGHDVGLGREWNEGMSVAAWIKAEELLTGAGPRSAAPSDPLTLGWLGAPGRPSQPSVQPGNILHKGGWRLAVDGRGGLTVCFGAGVCLKSPGPLTAGAWHHVAVSSGLDHEAHLYLDGMEVAQGRLPPRTSEPQTDLIAGAGFRGLLDEIE